MNLDDFDPVEDLPPPPPREIPAADRELLELAARTLRTVRFEEVDGEGYANLHFADGSTLFAWNPLVHSDDAFDLAVKLELDVNHRVVGGRRVEVIPAGFDSFAEPYKGDPVAATRRAIVRAAAEVGRVMP